MRIPYTVLLLVASFLLSANAQPQTRFAAQVTASPVEVGQMEQAIVGQINIIRLRHNLRSLKQNQSLMRAALRHSRNMAVNRFFDHKDPQGHDVGDRTRAEKYSWQSVGENIAMNEGYKNPVALAVDEWMKSRGHRENILRAHYTETGVGVVKIGNRYFFTQVFGRPIQSGAWGSSDVAEGVRGQ